MVSTKPHGLSENSLCPCWIVESGFQSEEIREPLDLSQFPFGHNKSCNRRFPHRRFHLRGGFVVAGHLPRMLSSSPPRTRMRTRK